MSSRMTIVQRTPGLGSDATGHHSSTAIEPSSSGMTEIEDLFDDVDAAFESLKLSGDDETGQRRAG